MTAEVVSLYGDLPPGPPRPSLEIGQMLVNLQAMNDRGNLVGVIVGFVCHDLSTGKTFAYEPGVPAASIAGAADLARDFFMRSLAAARPDPL